MALPHDDHGRTTNTKTSGPTHRPPGRSPATVRTTADLYFLEHRAKLIDIAAFFDRIDRAADAPAADFRISALREACRILLDDQPGRAARVLDALSDHSTQPIESAAGMKGAYGAPAPDGEA